MKIIFVALSLFLPLISFAMYTDGSSGFGSDALIAVFVVWPTVFFFLPFFIITKIIYGIFERADLEAEWQKKLKKFSFFLKKFSFFLLAVFTGLAIVLWTLFYFHFL